MGGSHDSSSYPPLIYSLAHDGRPDELVAVEISLLPRAAEPPAELPNLLTLTNVEMIT